LGTKSQKISAKVPINKSQSHAGVGDPWDAFRPPLVVPDDNRRSQFIAPQTASVARIADSVDPPPRAILARLAALVKS
jgi:hypothetical protein